MNRRQLLVASMATAAALALAGCDESVKAPSAPEVVSASQPLSMELLQRAATGFTVGQEMSTRVVYVFYDMQCPHCGTLWEAAKPLHQNVKFVWVPVGMLSRASIAQGATILESKNPVADMNEHEASLAARKGGMAADSGAMDRMGDKVRANSKLLESMGARSVPYIVTKDAITGALVTREGSLPTTELRVMLRM
jgi:thiol:disulfide interchange protein DsbG